MGDVSDKSFKKSEKYLKYETVLGICGETNTTSISSDKVTKFKAFNFDKRTSKKLTLPLCHFDSYNLWLLKPTHLNRGRGIHVFRDLETLHKLISQYCQGKQEEALSSSPQSKKKAEDLKQ